MDSLVNKKLLCKNSKTVVICCQGKQTANLGLQLTDVMSSFSIFNALLISPVLVLQFPHLPFSLYLAECISHVFNPLW